MRASGSTSTILRLGNETPDTGSQNFYKVKQQRTSSRLPCILTLAGRDALDRPVLKFSIPTSWASRYQRRAAYGVADLGQVAPQRTFRSTLEDHRVPRAAGSPLVGGAYYPRAGRDGAVRRGPCQASSYSRPHIPLHPTSPSGRREEGLGHYPFS